MTGGHFAAQHEASPMASVWQLPASPPTGCLSPGRDALKLILTFRKKQKTKKLLLLKLAPLTHAYCARQHERRRARSYRLHQFRLLNFLWVFSAQHGTEKGRSDQEETRG